MTPFIPILDARPTSSLHHGGPLDPPNLPYIPQQHDFHTCRDHIADLGLCRCGQSTITARRRCQDPCRTPPSGIGIEGIPFDLPQPPLLNFHIRQRDHASQTPYWRSPRVQRPADFSSLFRRRSWPRRHNLTTRSVPQYLIHRRPYRHGLGPADYRLCLRGF